jgi:DNA-binding response OmpR family regulator
MNDYLTKPIVREALQATLRKHAPRGPGHPAVASAPPPTIRSVHGS